MFDISSIGANVRHFRRLAGLTQSALAERLNVSFQAISGWENSVTVPDIDNLCRLAAVFGVSTDRLLSAAVSGDERVMIAVDGGGTKSEFVLFTSDGRILKCFKLEGTNAVVYGLDTVVRTLASGIDACLAERADVAGIFIGTAGPRLAEIEKQVSARYPGVPVFLASDAVNALMSAEADAAVIAGTGSIVITKNDDGVRIIGGWGYRVGDPGSAYNFGREAVRIAYSHEDGVLCDELVYRLVLERLDITRLRGYTFGDKSASFIAGLSRIIFDAYALGSAEAARVIDLEMENLSDLIRAACPVGRVVMCGGVMENCNEVLFPILEAHLGGSVELILPELPPIYGAAVECCNRLGVSRSDDFCNNFSFDYEENR